MALAHISAPREGGPMEQGKTKTYRARTPRAAPRGPHRNDRRMSCPRERRQRTLAAARIWT